MTGKAALFGGALMAAGMSANAQSFIYLDSGLGGAYPSFAQSVAYGGFGDVAYAPDPLNTMDSAYNAYTGTTTMSTTQTANNMTASGSWDGSGVLGYGYGIAQFQQFFMVGSNDLELLIEWDVSGTDAYASSIVLETAGGTTVFAFDPLFGGDPLVGSATVPLQAGVEYAYLGGLVAGGAGPFIFSSTDTQFVSATLIPAPGAAGLLGIAGLAATRRRR